MGLHTGTVQANATDDHAGSYLGYLTLTRAQRVMSTAYGDQVLLSNPTAELVRGELPAGVALKNMGEHRLKGLINPEQLWQIVAPDLRQDFPPLKTLNTIPHNLPEALTSFIGREKEIAELVQELSEHRLVTLTGAGGTGKTSTARALSKWFSLPIVEVRLSMITSQYLGETSKNIDKVFELAKRLAPCILLIDEFDFVAKTRTSDEHGAMKRAVNSLLKAIDEIGLVEHGVLIEEWGGDVPCVGVSAKQQEGIEDLLENILVVAEVGEAWRDRFEPGQRLVLQAAAG